MKTNNIIYIFLSIVFLSSCNKNNKPEAYGTFEAVEVIVSSEATGKILDFNIIFIVAVKCFFTKLHKTH